MVDRLDLDTICNASTYWSQRWQPALRRNQSHRVLTLVVSKLFGASYGYVFRARVRASHASLASSLELSREWVCEMIHRLRQAGWLRTTARRLPDGTQEVTEFRAGPSLKRMMVMLLKAKQRHKNNRVNNRSQENPTPEQIEKGKAFLQGLIVDLTDKLGTRKSR